MPDSSHPHSWDDWYGFAQKELGLLHDECVEYANLRYVEEQNRAVLRARGAELPKASLPRTSAPQLRPGFHPG